MQTNPYQSLVSLLSNILEAYTTAFFIVDQKSRRLNLVASQTLSKFLPDALSIPLEQSGILSQVQKVGQTIHLEKLQEIAADLSSTVPFYREGESHIKGLFAIPVGDAAGVLYVDTKYQWGFNDKQQKWIREIAELLHVLMQRQDCITQQQCFSRVFEFWRRLEESSSKENALDEYCQLIVNECTRFLGIEYGFMSLKEPRKHHFHVVAATSNVPRSLTNQRLLVKQGLVGWCFQNQKPLLISRLNSQTPDHFLFSPSEGLPHHGTFWGLPTKTLQGHSVVLAFLSRQYMEWGHEEQYAITRTLHFYRLLLDQYCFHEECQQLKAYDLSTGLYNTLAFEARLEGILSASMHNSIPFTLALVQFEPWQIFYTKASPKQVRKWQADLAASLTEIFPSNALLGQIAENRFGIVFPELTPQDARRYLPQLNELGKQFFSGKIRGTRLQAYSSLVGFPQDGTRSEELWSLVYRSLFSAFRSKTEKIST